MRNGLPKSWRDRLPIVALLGSALAISGCSAGTGLGSATTAAPPPAAGSAGSPSLSEKISSFFSGSTAKSRQGVAGAQADVNCPFIDIRQGAGTLAIGPPGDNSAMALKYQGTFVRAARECSIAGTNMAVKLGVQGRLIVGPAGGPGMVDVPLRIAVVHETTAGSNTITTKLVRIPVTVGAGQPFADFTHIEEALTFPLPPPAQLDDYTIYIGFDPLAADAQDRQKSKPKPRPPRVARPG
jgi:hypothetical protein